MLKKHPKWLPVLLFTLVLLCGGALLLWQTGFFASLGSLENMRAYIDRFSPYSHLFYFIIQLLSVIVAPIPSNITALAGALLFGAWPAFLLTWGAVTLGSVLVFWLARALGQPFVDRFVGEKVSAKYMDLIRRKRDVFLFLAFLFPFFPDDLLCILAGLTDIPMGRFLMITLLTRPWGLLVSCMVGGSVVSIPVPVMVLIGVVGIILFLVCMKYGDRWEQKLLERFKT